MEWSGCMSLLQGYLENSPLIVLGSGASMPYELPSMGGLAEEIRKSIVEAGINKYLIFECSDSTHTKVYGNGWEETYEGQYWLLDNFMNIW